MVCAYSEVSILGRKLRVGDMDFADFFCGRSILDVFAILWMRGSGGRECEARWRWDKRN